MERGLIEIAPLAFMRGRTLNDSFIILDEAQNTTPEQMQAFVEGCRAVIKNSSLTRKDSYEVHMSGFGDSALEVMLYFFFECAIWSDELRGKHNVMLEIMRLAESLGISFAFPTQSLHVESLVQPTAKRPPAQPAAREGTTRRENNNNAGIARNRPSSRQTMPKT